MSRLSVVIFGATGFTGKHAALEMARLVRKHRTLTWGVAGRSQSKLEDLLRDIAKTTGEDQTHVRIIVADVNDAESLKQMCGQAQVVANCCGPYRLYGEPVVKAAVEMKAHHVDVSGEPQFIETMQLKYDAAAREAGVYVISACGYDSIPNDMGVVFLQQNFGGTVNAVESYMSTHVPDKFRAEAREHGVINSGTWDSLVYGLAHWSELKPIRQKMFPDSLPPLTPKLMPRGLVHSNKCGRSCVPFLGADNSIVYRSQRRLRERDGTRPAQFRAYLQLESYLQAVLLVLGGILLAVMAKFEWSRELLLKHPRMFSAGLATRAGPTAAVTHNSSFVTRLYGSGWAAGADVTQPPNKTVLVKVSGMNPGYGATVIALLYCAITVLEEKDKMPAGGGVLTTAVAFKDTNLIKNLNENGIKFEIIESAAI